MLRTVTRDELVREITSKLDLVELRNALEKCTGTQFTMKFDVPSWAIADGTWSRHIPDFECSKFDPQRGWKEAGIQGHYTHLHVGVSCTYNQDFSWTCGVYAGHEPEVVEENLLLPAHTNKVTGDELAAYFIEYAEDIVSRKGDAVVITMIFPPGMTRSETRRWLRENPKRSVSSRRWLLTVSPQPYRLYLSNPKDNMLVAHVNCAPSDTTGHKMFAWPSCERIHIVPTPSGPSESTEDLWETVENAGDEEKALETCISARDARLNNRLELLKDSAVLTESVSKSEEIDTD